MQNAKKKINKRVDLTAGIQVTAVPEDINVVGKAAPRTDLQYGEVEVLVSNSALDRHGESILMEGIDTTQVERNPVLLWAHQYDSLPIGKIVKLWKTGGNLMARIKFAYDLYAFADTVYKMVLNNVISAVSIGGIAKQWNRDYTVIEKMEMIELSVVPVGAHPDALVTAKSLGIKSAELKEQFNQFVAQTSIDRLKGVSDNDADKYLQTLKELVALLEGRVTPKERKDAGEEQIRRVIKYKLDIQ